MLRHHSCSSKFNFKYEIRFINNARYKKELRIAQQWDIATERRVRRRRGMPAEDARDAGGGTKQGDQVGNRHLGSGNRRP